MVKQFIAPVLIFLFLVSTLYLFTESNNLKNQNKELSGNLTTTTNLLVQINATLLQTKNMLNEKTQLLTATKDELQDIKSELEETKNKLQQKEAALKNTTANFQELEQRYGEMNKTMTNLKLELTSLEQTIKDSIKWFKKNSNFSEQFLENDEVKSFVNRVESKCISDNNVNLGCLVFQMEKRLGFKYVLEEGDRLYSLEEIIKNKGGDCEDYSIFTMALLNYLKSASSEDALDLVGWKWKLGSRFIIYEASGSSWYIPNAEAYTMGALSKLNPFVFCYTAECTNGVCNGHCVVGLSKTKLENTSSLSSIHNAKLFEPQTGGYLGKIGTDYFLCEDGIKNCDIKLKYGFVIIGDSDLYIFKNGNWTSYAYYLNKIEELKKI